MQIVTQLRKQKTESFLTVLTLNLERWGRTSLVRKTDPKTKTLRLVLVGKEGQEEKIRAFRDIVARNNLCISTILFEKVENFLREHHWPPGNSQTIITSFSGEPKVMQSCQHPNCSRQANHEVWAENGWHGFLCESCFARDREAGLLRRWKPLVVTKNE